MSKHLKLIFQIALISLLPTLFIWLPFFLRMETFWGIPLSKGGMATIVSNYDGPLYLVVAKTLYNISEITQNYSFGLPAEYYPAHFPFFPLLIKIFSVFFGFPYSMLFVTLATSILAVYLFHKFISDFVEKDNALWITFVFSIFPARWLIVRSVGSAEPLFVAAIIASVYFFRKEKYLWAGIWGAVAQLTKSPGILLLISYVLILMIPYLQKTASIANLKFREIVSFKKIIPLLLIPVSLFGIFIFFKIRMNDFWAYFHSGDNIHLFFPPFQIFNYSMPWVGTFWLEEVIFVYLFGALGIVKLIKKKETVLALVTAVFFVSILFVSHRDIIRYSLPIVPFLFAAFSDELTKKDFRYVAFLLLIPIYLFSLGYISQNIMPIADWAPFL